MDTQSMILLGNVFDVVLGIETRCSQFYEKSQDLRTFADSGNGFLPVRQSTWMVEKVLNPLAEERLETDECMRVKETTAEHVQETIWY